MSMNFRRPAALTAAAALLSVVALADKIYLVDGKTHDEVSVINETLSGVVYRAKGKSGDSTVPAEQVLRVEYDQNVPSKIKEAIEELKGDGPERFEEAASTFFLFADGVLSGARKEKALWAPAYALNRALELQQSINTKASMEEVIKIADLMAAKAPDSRYLPLAIVAKASALRDLGRTKEAADAVTALKDLVKAKALSDAYRLQAELVEVEIGALKGTQKRDRLIEIGTQAGNGFPLVRSRARVLEAETYLEGESKNFAKAREIYAAVIKDPKADPSTLAGAYTGMGDCLFQEAADKLRVSDRTAANAALKDAALSFLRVVIVYEDQVRYAPKAMYFAARAFELMESDDPSVKTGNRTNSRRMLTELITTYPNSEWAQQARSSRR